MTPADYAWPDDDLRQGRQPHYRVLTELIYELLGESNE